MGTNLSFLLPTPRSAICRSGRSISTRHGKGPIDQSFYVYDQGQVALEFHQSGSGDLDAADLSHRYLWGPAVDQLLADEQVDWSDSDADGEVLWALTDNLGTVRDVVDSQGDLRIHRVFDGFGNIVDETHYNASGSAVTGGQAGFVDVAFAFTGRYLDQATGLQNNLNRWYDGHTGRWMSEAPIGYEAGDSNLYRYVGNSPTDLVDPDGLITGQIGYAGDGTLDMVHVGGDFSVTIGFSFNSYPFFTWGVGGTIGGGPALGGGASAGMQFGATTARNCAQTAGQGLTGGVNTPIGGVGFLGGPGYGGVYVAPSPGPIADVHVNDTHTVCYGNTGSSEKADWAWPLSENASWNVYDTWDVWFGGRDR